MNVFNFFHDKRGSITVELCLVTLFFVLLFFILSTTAQYINTKGRFDSIAYSLSSVLRERTVLYAGQPLLTEAQADQLVRVASELFRDNHMDFNKPGAALLLESLYFEDDPQSPGTNQTQIQNAQTFVRPLSSAQGTPSCSPAESLRAIVERIERTEKRSFSVKKKGIGINHEWIPFYRVTICMPPPDFNLSVFPSHFLPEIKSSSPMMLAR